MNTTTAAQRYNKRMDAIFNIYHRIEDAKADLLPTCIEYSWFLTKTVEKKITLTREEAKAKYGTYTYGQWKQLLNLW